MNSMPSNLMSIITLFVIVTGIAVTAMVMVFIFARFANRIRGNPRPGSSSPRRGIPGWFDNIIISPDISPGDQSQGHSTITTITITIPAASMVIMAAVLMPAATVTVVTLAVAGDIGGHGGH